MRNCRVVAVSFLALIAFAACAGNLETVQPTATLELSTPVATELPTDAETYAPVGQNVAPLGYGRASAWSESAHLAIDGELDTMWGASAPPAQWYSVILDDLYLVDGIEMVVAQTPAGPTTHEIWLGDSSGTRTLYKHFRETPTEDGQTLVVVVDPPRIISELLIHTLHSPSWVAWREVRVYGSPSETGAEGVGASGLKLSKVTAGLDLPVQVTHADDGSGRLFVVEQKGRIRIIKEGAINDIPFLDISDRISCCGERGLIGVAFPPEYATKGHFYVSYTNVEGHTVVSRFSTTADPDRADSDSEEGIVTIEQPYLLHNGGRMVFGPRDGYLYIGSGNGGSPSFTDPDNRGQGTDTLLGKMLRIDVESGVKPYGIPASNPFVQVAGYRDEIWALGLRNPWGFAFDEETGDLYLPDVGNGKREEVNYQPATSRGGENYGWSIKEGSACFEARSSPCSTDGLTSPVAEYDHARGCAIVGGAVYRGTAFSRLQGAFIFADFCNGQIWGLTRSDAVSQGAWQSRLLIDAPFPVSSIGEDEEGNVYVTGYQDGVISMIAER